MTGKTLPLAVGVAVAETAGALALVITSNHEPHKLATAALAVTAGVSFVAAGLIALHRRPENRTGVYLAGVGYLWFFGALSDANNDAVYTAGLLFGSLAFIPFAALVLAFPSGRLMASSDRLLVRFTAAFVILCAPLPALVNSRPLPGCKGDCPTSAIVVYDSHKLARTLDALLTTIVLALITVVVVLLVRRWRRSSTALRRVQLPVYLAGGGALVALLLVNLLSQISTGAADALAPVFLVIFAAVPFAFLLGILRSRLARGSVASLVVSIGQGLPLRDAIAEALGDPSLELAYWLDGGKRYVDREGRTFDLPGTSSGRTATVVERDGRRVGALVHDESLGDARELVESVCAAVALALDNERLQTEARAQYDLLLTIVDTAPSLLVTIDPSGQILNLNPATLRASGFDDEETVRGRLFWDVFIDAEEREAMIARFYLAAPDFAPAEYENAFTNSRGEELVIAWRSAPLKDESGKVIGIIAGGLDITERKRQELELHSERKEVRESRIRIVAAGDEARRRLERNLHDGAQQRLVSLSIALRLAQAKVKTDPAATAEILANASDELAHALEELRELARGIHPAVLTDRGLNAALESLAGRTPLPVDLTTFDARLPEPIEAAAYYVVSEAVTNVVKHAHASSVQVRLHSANGSVVIEVADDGVGGADARGGSGLRGLADRVAVLDGRIRVESPPNGGTRVIAEIPVQHPAVATQ